MAAKPETTRRAEELVRSHEERAREASALDERLEHLLAAAELSNQKLKDFPRAEALLRQAATAAPASEEPLRALRLFYEQRQNPTALAPVVEKLAERLSGPEAAGFFLQAARLYEGRLKQHQRAVLCYQRASKADPQEREAFVAARRLLLSEGRFATALETLDRERAALGPAGLADEYAKLAAQLVDDPTLHALADRAIQSALQLEPGHQKALAAKAAITSLSSTWKDRVRALRAGIADEPDRRVAAQNALLVAKLLATYEPAGRDKIKEALDRCLLLSPAMPQALDFLEAASRAGTLPDPISWLEAMASAQQNRRARAELYLRAAVLRLCRQGDGESALQNFEKAAQAAPAWAEPTYLALELLLDKGRAAQAAALLLSHADAVEEPLSQLSARLQLAALFAERLNEPVKALAQLEAARALEPSHPELCLSLCTLRLRQGQLEKAEETLEHAVTANVPLSRRVELAAQLARALAAAKKNGATAVFARALRLDPSRVELVEEATAFARATQALPELAAGLQKAAKGAPAQAGLALWRASARIFEEASLSKEAEHSWKQVLALREGDEEATRALEAKRSQGAVDDLTALREQARAAEGDPRTAFAAHRELLLLRPDELPALRGLLSSALAIGRWEDAAQAAERLCSLGETPQERSESRLRLARLCAERLGQAERAVELLLPLVEDVAAGAEAVALLERLSAQGVRKEEISAALLPHYASVGDFQRQVVSLLVQLGASKDPQAQRQLLAQLAQLQEDRLADARAALASWLRAVHLEPADKEARGHVLRLAAQLDAQPELARALLELSTRAAPEISFSILMQAVELSQGAAPDDAERILCLALERAKDEPSLLERLYRLRRKMGRPAEAEGPLRRRLELAAPNEKASWGLELCELCVELARPRAAALALEDAIRAGADEAAHAQKLCELWAEAKDDDRLAVALERAIHFANQRSDEAAVSRLSLQRARLLETSPADRTAALRQYAEVLSKRPADPDALVALEGLLEDPNLRVKAGRALAPAYERLSEHRKLAGVLEVLAESASEPSERLSCLKRLAELQLDQLHAPLLSFAALARALLLAPEDRALHAAAQLAAEKADALDSYVEVLVELCESAPPGTRGMLHKSLAGLFERHLGDRASAISHLRAAALLDPQDAEALLSLRRLHQAAEEWAALAEVLEGLAAISAEPKERLAALREAASVHERRLYDEESALACWLKAAHLDPKDEQAASAIERLAAALDRPQQLAFALELRRAQQPGEPRGKDATARLAALKLSRMASPTEALALCREVLAADPSHPATLNVLDKLVATPGAVGESALALFDQVLQRADDPERRVALRRARLAIAAPEERARLLVEVCQLLEKELHQSSLAFMEGLKAFGDGVARVALLPELLRLARATGSLDELAEALESTTEELSPGHAELAPLLREAARLFQELGQPEASTRLWNDLLGEVPDDPEALEKLAGLYELTQNAKNASAVYERQAQLEPDGPAKAQLLVKAAMAHEQLDEEQKAIDSYQAAIELEKSSEALEGLDRLLPRAGRWLEHAAILAQLSALAPSADGRLPLLRRRARSLERAPDEAQRVRGFADVLLQSPNDEEAQRGLERLLDVPGCAKEAARLLEPLYRAQGDSRGLAQVLELRLEQLAHADRAKALEELARLHEAQGDLRLAFAARLRGFAANPAEPLVRGELERLAEQTGAFEELVAAYEDQLERPLPDALAAQLWRKVAVLEESRLQRLDRALDAWDRACRHVRGEPELLRHYAEACRRARNFRRLGEVLERRVEAEPSKELQLDLLFELAQLGEESLGDKALATRCYEQILARAPEEKSALSALSRLYADARQYEALGRVLEKELALCERSGWPEEALELELRLARLWLGRLGQPTKALEALKRVVAKRPAHPPALALLEELAFSDGPCRPEAMSTLEPLLEGVGGHLRLAQLLEAKVAEAATPSERAELLRRVAHVRAGPLADPEMAFLAQARALREEPHDEATLVRCITLGRQAGAEEELCALLESLVPEVNGPQRLLLLRSLAPLQLEQQDESGALESWRTLLLASPDEEPVALAAVEQLLSRPGKEGALAWFLEERLERVEGEERGALMLRLASAQETLGREQEAIATLQSAFAAGHAGALTLLEELFGRHARHLERAEVLSRMAEQPGADARALKLRRAKVLEEAERPDVALAVYEELVHGPTLEAELVQGLERLVQLEPTRARAALALEPVYRAHNDQRKHAVALEALLEDASGERKKQLREELASLYASLGEWPKALALRLAALLELPQDEATRLAFERVAEQAGRLDELVRTYEELLKSHSAEPLRAALHQKLAHGYQVALGKPAQALAHWEELSRLQPDKPEPLAAMAGIYRAATNYEHLARVLSQQAQLEPSPEAQVDLLYELAQLGEEQLGDLGLAANAYRQILQRLPDERGAAKALATVLERARRFPELKEALETELAGAQKRGASDEGADLELRLGQLSLRHLSAPEHALSRFEAALAKRPGHPGAVFEIEALFEAKGSLRAAAAAALEPVYRARADKRRLAEVLEVIQASSPARQEALLEELSGLKEALGELRGAFGARLLLYQRAPADERTRSELARLAEAGGLQEELCAAYEHQLRRETPGAFQEELHRKLAHLTERLGRRERAVELWEKLLSNLPKDAEGLRALSRLYREAGELKQLPRLLELQLSLAASQDEQAAILFELATLSYEKLGDRAQAVSACQRLLSLRPGDVRAAELLERLLSESGRHGELAELLQTRLDQAERAGEPTQAVGLLLRLARLRLGALGDAEGALELLRRVLQTSPDDSQALEALEELLGSSSPARVAAAELLEPVFTRNGDDERLARALEVRAQAETRVEERVALLHRLADLYDGKLWTPLKAFGAVARALEASPEDEHSLQRCVDLAAVSGASEALAELLEDTFEKASSAAPRLAVARAQARVLSGLGQSSEAISSWQRVLSLAPGDEETLLALSSLLEGERRFGELVEVLQRRLATASGDQAVLLLRQLGCLQDDALADAQAALVTFRKLLELRGKDVEALRRVDRLCGALGLWSQQADALAELIALEPKESTELELRLARLEKDRLGNAAKARFLLTGVLDKSPSHPAALAELEAWLEKEPQDEQASRVLLDAYRRNGDAVRLCALLEARASAAPTSAERKALWRELSAVRSKELADASGAFVALARAFKEEPKELSALEALERAAAAADAHEELAAVLQECLAMLEGAEAAELCLRLGQLEEKALQEPERAVAAYQRARAWPATNAKALFALRPLLERLGDWQALAEVLSASAQAEADRPGKLTVLPRLAELSAQQLNEPKRAAAVWEQVLELEPRHLTAARALEGLYEGLTEAIALERSLARLVALEQGAERNRVRLKLARAVARQQLERALKLCQEVLSEEPRHEEAFELLSELLQAGGRAEELLTLLQARLAVTLEPAAAAALHRGIGRVLAGPLKRPAEAVTHFQAALEREPKQLESLQALVELYALLKKDVELASCLRRLTPLQAAGPQQDSWLRLVEVEARLGRSEGALEAARKVLEAKQAGRSELARVRTALEPLGASPEAIEVTELLAAAEQTAGQKARAVQLLFEAASLRAGTGDERSASIDLERILQLEPDNRQAYEAARKLYSSHGAWEEYAKLLSSFAPKLTATERLAVFDELSQVLEEHRNRPKEAFEATLAAVRLEPSNEKRLQRAEHLAGRVKGYEEVAKLYEELGAAVGPVPSELLALRQARVLDEKLEKPKEAEAVLRALLEKAPAPDAALSALVELFSRRGPPAALAEVLERQLELSPAGAQKKELLLRLSKLREEQLKDLPGAANALRRLFELSPERPVATLLCALHRRAAQWPELLDALLRARELPGTAAERAAVQLEIARLQEGELNAPEAAVDAYLRLLELDASSKAAFESLERLLVQLDRPAELLAAYERRLSVSKDAKEKASLWMKSAQLWERRGALVRADSCIEEALSLFPKDAVALDALVRIRTAARRWEPLFFALELKREAAETPAAKAQLAFEAGQLALERLNDPEKARHSFEKALELAPAHKPALHALIDLHVQADRWTLSTRLLERAAELETEPLQKANWHHRAAELRRAHRDFSGAKASFQQALSAAPSHLPTLRALKALHKADRDFAAYVRVLTKECDCAEGPKERAAAALELAEHLAATQLDAAPWYERAHKEEPSLETARALCELHWRRQDFGNAARWLEGLLSHLDAAKLPKHAKERLEPLIRLAHAERSLGRADRALQALGLALEIDPNEPAALKTRAELLSAAGRAKEALEDYRRLLLRPRPSVAGAELAALHAELGRLHWGLGNVEDAQLQYERALALDSLNMSALRALVEISDKTGRADRGVAYRKRLVNSVPAAEQLALHLEVGRLAEEKLADPQLCIEAYQKARQLAPTQAPVLRGLAKAHRAAGQARQALEVLTALLALPAVQSDLPARRQLQLELSELAEKELRDLDRGASVLESALDADPAFSQAFVALEALLSNARRWRQLEESTLRMLRRQESAPAPQRAQLWRALAELRLQKLNDKAGALEALHSAAAAVPKDLAAQEQYAKLAVLEPAHEERAVAAYVRALPAMTEPARACIAVSRLAHKRGETDLAYLAARAAEALFGAAEPTERALLEAMGPKTKTRARPERSLTDRLWQDHMLHPMARGPLGELLALLFDRAGERYALSLSECGLNAKKHRVDLSSTQHPALQHLRVMAKALGFENVELYCPFLAAQGRAEPQSESLSLAVCHTHPFGLVAGGRLLSERSLPALYSTLGRNLVLLRPEFALVQRLPSERVEAVVQAALQLGSERYTPSLEDKALKPERKLLEKGLDDAARTSLSTLTRKYLERAAPDDLIRFTEGVKLSSYRGALLAAGDFEPLRGELLSEGKAGPRTEAKLRELAHFALSGDWTALRSVLGWRL